MNDLISRKALIAEYDRVHIGPPGGARKLIEEAPAVQQWISVKDRLPEEYETVLAYDGDCVEPSVFYGDYGFYELDKYEADPLCGVTHWMPLPEPPKGE